MERFSYDRTTQAVGIVHFGIGAFHRAHQAWYTDQAMESGDRNWAISGVSLRSRQVARQLNPQCGLYTVTEQSRSGSSTRLIGSIRNVVPALQVRKRVEGMLSARSTRIVSFTITEKGYCRTADGSLDLAQADANSIFPFLAEGLRRRRDAGIGGLTLLSCDNLAGNGAQLARLLGEYLDRHDPALRSWFERECLCPSTMVDRIVPATTPSDLAALSMAMGLEDAGATLTEPFSQWVIEDRFAAGRPAWQKVGAQLVEDVVPYEAAKLRMLNGAHSALAYLGLAAGCEYVHEAVADPAIRSVVERLMREEAATSLTPAPGQDLGAYAGALLTRFANPALRHRLAQIAMDGSQKIPQRWLETLTFHQQRGTQCPSILAGLAAWLRHVRGDNGGVDDPAGEALRDSWRKAGKSEIVEAILGSHGLVASDWRPSAREKIAIESNL